VSAISKTPERVVIAIDPHKASWTAAVVDASSQPSSKAVNVTVLQFPTVARPAERQRDFLLRMH
jgi:hypothetical protein